LFWAGLNVTETSYSFNQVNPEEPLQANVGKVTLVMPQLCPCMPFALSLKQFVDPKGVDYNTRL
jgi:hypothetical protein